MGKCVSAIRMEIYILMSSKFAAIYLAVFLKILFTGLPLLRRTGYRRLKTCGLRYPYQITFSHNNTPKCICISGYMLYDEALFLTHTTEESLLKQSVAFYEC